MNVIPNDLKSYEKKRYDALTQEINELRKQVNSSEHYWQKFDALRILEKKEGLLAEHIENCNLARVPVYGSLGKMRQENFIEAFRQSCEPYSFPPNDGSRPPDEEYTGNKTIPERIQDLNRYRLPEGIVNAKHDFMLYRASQRQSGLEITHLKNQVDIYATRVEWLKKCLKDSTISSDEKARKELSLETAKENLKLAKSDLSKYNEKGPSQRAQSVPQNNARDPNQSNVSAQYNALNPNSSQRSSDHTSEPREEQESRTTFRR